MGTGNKRRRVPFFEFSVAYSIAIPAISFGMLSFILYQSFVGALLLGLQFGLFGFLGFLLVIHNRALRRARIERGIEQRKLKGGRSPWGERREAEPTPYSDRLAHFLTVDVEPAENLAARSQLKRFDDSQLGSSNREPSEWGQPDFRSSMRFWSSVDLPRDPFESKPLWIIRRILLRIREAIASS